MKEFFVKARKYFADLWQLLLPDQCSFCKRSLSVGVIPKGICPSCFSALHLRPEEKTLLKLLDPITEVEQDALALFCLAYYEKEIRHAIRALKFYDQVEFSTSLASLLAIFLKELMNRYPDIFSEGKGMKIMALPLHPKRLKERSYNQVELVLEKLSEYIQFENYSQYIKRNKYTKRQSECENREERVRNLEDAFCLSDEINWQEKDIILLDDVVSSGASMWSAARVLLNKGAKVTLLCLASNKKA